MNVSLLMSLKILLWNLDKLTRFGRARVNSDWAQGESRAEGLCVEARFSLVTEAHTSAHTRSVFCTRNDFPIAELKCDNSLRQYSTFVQMYATAHSSQTLWPLIRFLPFAT